MVSKISPYLFEKVKSKIPSLVSRVDAIKRTQIPIATLQVKDVLTGLRGVPALNSFTCEMSPKKGPIIRGKTISELFSELPNIDGIPLPESVFWYLLTGEIPTQHEISDFIDSLQPFSDLPDSLIDCLDILPENFPATSLLSIGILQLQENSEFSSSHSNIKRKDLWIPAFEDSLSIIAKLPSLLGYIYTKRSVVDMHETHHKDFAGKFLGHIKADTEKNAQFMRLFLSLYCDSDSGSVGAHASKAIGSTLSDPYKAISGCINGVSGHLHGGAVQDSLEWIIKANNFYRAQAQADLKANKAIPGFGHAVLGTKDPRYEFIYNYWKLKDPNHAWLKNIEKMELELPQILKEKLRDPQVNGDFIAGAALYAFGIRDGQMGPAILGASRSFSCLANYIWDRACELPIEYAMSFDIQGLEDLSNN